MRDLSLTQAFYKLLDENKEYWCALSTLYRLFRARGLNARRAPTREARRRSKPTAYSAQKPNEVWTWDITYLRSSKYTGRFYYAYVIVDVYSRMVVSARVFEADNADLSARTVLHSCIKGFLRAKKLWVNPPKAERAKPSLSSDYNLLFKNKIGKSSLDIHRPSILSCFLYRQHFDC